jgi:hypothetical protein
MGMSFINDGLSRLFRGVVGEWDDPRLVVPKRGSPRLIKRL